MAEAHNFQKQFLSTLFILCYAGHRLAAGSWTAVECALASTKKNNKQCLVEGILRPSNLIIKSIVEYRLRFGNMKSWAF